MTSFLGRISQKFLSIYRSFGTYIAFLTILLTVYLVKPNCVSFGYVLLLLVWIIGRQLVERTKKRLWFPLKVYAVTVFVFIYCLSSFTSFKIWMSRYIDLYFYLGYNTEALLLANVWESLAVLVVMQLYSYERRQSKYIKSIEPNPLETGVLGFARRLLIWHSHKILLVALFYAALSPISAIGLVYLVGLVICATLPKGSQHPSKSFLVYTGFIVSAEYLFQIWGEQAKVFPGQKHSYLSRLLGLRVYDPGFWGIESGLRPKVLVIVACIFQYNVFYWLRSMHSSKVTESKWEEPCPLFVSAEDAVLNHTLVNEESKQSPFSSTMSTPTSNSSPPFSHFSQAPHAVSSKVASESTNGRKFSFGYLWGSTKESHKWNRKRIVTLRTERFEMQKTLLKIYLKFWMENMFNLYGLEITMIGLLLASFALLNVVSMVYIALIASCVLLRRRIIRKLWPVVVFLFASILVLEYFAIWNSASLNEHVPIRPIKCNDCWRSSTLYFQFCRSCWLGTALLNYMHVALTWKREILLIDMLE